MLIRIAREWMVVRRTVEYFIEQLKIEKSLKHAFKNTFSKFNGKRKFKIEDGPWMYGSHYDFVRYFIIGRRKG